MSPARRTFLAALLVVAVVFAAHLPELSGWLSCDPILFDSSLDVVPSGVLPGSCYIDGNAGNTVMARGHLAAEMWLHGTVPWWDHFAGAGLPLAAEMQSTAMLLPWSLLLHFGRGMLAMKIALQATAGLFALAALRAAGFSLLASTLGATCFELGSAYAWFDDAPMQPVAFLPLLILGIERCAAGRARSGVAFTALGIAFSLYAGFPETAFADGLFGLLWTALAAVRGGRRALPRVPALVAAGGALGLLLALPILVPFLEDLAISTVRSHAMSMAVVVPADQAIAILFPSVFGAPIGDLRLGAWTAPFGSLGAATCLLALVSVASAVGAGRQRLRTACMVGWIAFCAAAAFRVPGLGTLVRQAPLIGQLDFTRYAAASVAFAAIVLAAGAIDAWRAGARPLRPGAGLVLFLLLAAVTVVLARDRLAGFLRATRGLPEPAAAAIALGSLALGVAVAVVAAATLRRAPTRRRAVLLLAVVTAEALAAFVVPELAGARHRTPDIAAYRFVRATAGDGRLYAIDDLLPNWGDYFGFGMLNETAVPLLIAWDDDVAVLSPADLGELFYGAFGPPAARAANFEARRAAFLDAGAVLVDLPAASDPWAGRVPANTRPVFRDARHHLYRLDDARPYAEADPPVCRLALRSRDDIRADCDAPATLLRREISAPGWRARIDGHRVAIGQAALHFQRVALPAGRSHLRFRYAPPGIGWIMAGFAVGLAALAALGLPAGFRASLRPRPVGRAG